MYAASSKSLMVKNPWGFSSLISMDRMAVLNVSRHTCHSPEGIWQIPSIPVRESSVVPIHVGGCGLISLRCIGLVANDATRWRNKISSECTSVYRFIRHPFAVLGACWRRVKIPATPDM